jgi:hypothetical protein
MRPFKLVYHLLLHVGSRLKSQQHDGRQQRSPPPPSKGMASPTEGKDGGGVGTTVLSMTLLSVSLINRTMLTSMLFLSSSIYSKDADVGGW